MRDMILQALKSKYLGDLNGHIANIEVMLTNPVGVGDHATIIDTVDKEMLALSNAHGRLDVLTRYIDRKKDQKITETKK